jgi:hypothetical protein
VSEQGNDILAALRDPRAEVRRRALLAAPADVNGALRAALLSALADPVWGVREVAATAVGRLPDATGDLHRALVRLTLEDPSPLVRFAAAVAVGSRVRPERDYGEAARHRFERQRIRGAAALGHVTGEHTGEAVQVLAGLLADSHPKVRCTALEALARLEPAALVPVAPSIVRRCGESEPKVTGAALAAWERLLAAPGAAVLLPLQPYPGTVDARGLRFALGALAPGHPLRAALTELPLPPEEETDTAKLARYLAQLCAHALNL